MIYSVIKGTGSYIPSKITKNEDFLNNEFYESNGVKINKTNHEIIDKFKEITTIEERRHVSDDQTTSELAYRAAKEALTSSETDPETLDYIIMAHNFGETKPGKTHSDFVPCLAARVKYKLKIQNPNTVSYDIVFGCPGWLQAMIQADYYIRSGDAKRVLVIGAEVLSRVSDPHDKDSMLYADGAGATLLEAKESETPIGILAHKTRSDTFLHSQMLYLGGSYNPDHKEKNDLFIKMNGRRLYQYALETVPASIKACLDKVNIPISKVSKVLIHQANGKMDDAILKRLYALYNMEEPPKNIMPMTIAHLGNASVATVPTLFNLIAKGQMEGHQFNQGDILVFASVGAGMNINALVYKV
ncbi:MAG TPA: ketoacyl-ACP synthase III [Bacteroidales bacterium]|nr:ketoacyl-ACP synthase III [Bacteroidales bacterium]